MLRRSLFGILCGAFIGRADDRTDALDAVAPIAAALSDADLAAVVAALPKDAPNYDELRTNLTGLIEQAEVTSSVEVLTAEAGAAELDWYMQVRNRATRMVIERRRGAVKIRFRRRRLIALEPASFFAPPKL